jgi:glycine/D-amino acid oxidase-like deaminating enzyme
VAHAGTVFLYTDTDQSPPRLAVGGTLGVFKTDGVMSRSSVYALPLSTLESPKEVQTAKVVGIIPMVDYASGGYLRTPDQSMVAIAAASVPPSGNSDSDNVRAYLESMRELNPTFFQTLVEQAEAANMPTPIL